MKKRKIAILLASSLAFVGVVSAFSLIKNENIELLGLESIEETYYIDDEFTVPEVKVKYQNKEYENAIKYINNMSKKELVEELIYIFDYAPEWVYDNFIRRNNIDGK